MPLIHFKQPKKSCLERLFCLYLNIEQTTTAHSRKINNFNQLKNKVNYSIRKLSNDQNTQKFIY